MLRTPLKNSKNVNKPFKSPFNSVTPNKEKVKTIKENAKQNYTPGSSPLSTRNAEAKRILLLDENEKETKKRKISESNDQNTPKKVFQCSPKQLSESLTKSDLLLLKRKVFELRQELDCLKSRQQCTKKHDPGQLKDSIDKWKTACQNALEIVCSEVTERNGQSSTITDVLKMLNIPEEIVGYSEKEDGFI